MQAGYDWRKHYTPEAFTKELGLAFRGPGFYLSGTDTILVIPLPPNEAAKSGNVWNIKQPSGTIYDVFVFNVPHQETIFSVIANAPVREDLR